MPSTGFYLFLQPWRKSKEKQNTLCQCPQRASTYFFQVLNELYKAFKSCQCPQRASTYFFKCVERRDRIQKWVSMPSTGFYLFLQGNWYGIKVERFIVSMPSTGFYLFLRRTERNKGIDDTLCQCPQRASTYFFRDWWVISKLKKFVSMPSTGFYLFLPLSWNIMDTISGSVNALNGLLLISSGSVLSKRWYSLVCQCPQRASTYFFQYHSWTVESMEDVSMPSTGFYLFLPHTGLKRQSAGKCVNALNGLLLISSDL